MNKDTMKKIAPHLAALKTKSDGFKLPKGALVTIENTVITTLKENQLKTKVGTQNPFKVSSNYFDDFEDSLLVTISGNPNLSSKNQLKVPDSYFENFEQSVLKKLHQSEIKKKSKIIALPTRFIKISAAIAVAASLALVFVFSPFQSSNELTFESLKITEMEAWIEQNQLKLDAYQIASVYKDEQLQVNLLNLPVKEDELEHFLMQYNLDELLYDY